MGSPPGPLSPPAPPGEEYRPLLPYRETSLRILATALSPLDHRKWRRKPWYWRLFKVFKVRWGGTQCVSPLGRDGGGLWGEDSGFGDVSHPWDAPQVPVELVLLLTVPVVDPDKDDLNWKRPLNCLHVVTSPLLCVLTLKSGACKSPRRPWTPLMSPKEGT